MIWLKLHTVYSFKAISFSIYLIKCRSAIAIQRTMDAPPDQSNHGHKGRKEGRGAKEAKKDKKAKVAGTRVERHNNRAFSVANIVRTQRTLQRNSDRKHQKEYVPQKDRRASKDSNEAPPSVVVVMGPPGVGKVSDAFRYIFVVFP